MENIALVVGFIAVVLAFVVGGTWQKICQRHRKEFLFFNVDFPTNLTQHLTNIGKAEYISANEDRYELAEIKALNANSEIMEGMRESLPGIYYSIRQLCSWRSRICRKK